MYNLCVVFLCRRDLWELRAEFSRLSSSLISVWASARSPPTLSRDSHIAHSTAEQPLSSTQGPLSLDDLNHEERKSTELKGDLESETLELENRSLQGSHNIDSILHYFKYSQYIFNNFAGPFKILTHDFVHYIVLLQEISRYKITRCITVFQYIIL